MESSTFCDVVVVVGVAGSFIALPAFIAARAACWSITHDMRVIMCVVTAYNTIPLMETSLIVLLPVADVNCTLNEYCRPAATPGLST